MFPMLLRRHILLLLVAKAVALTFIYFVFIAPAAKPEPTRAAIQAHLLDERPR